MILLNGAVFIIILACGCVGGEQWTSNDAARPGSQEWATLRYSGPTAIPVVRDDGTLVETPEVAAARAYHLAALEYARATNPDMDDGEYDPYKYGDYIYGVGSHSDGIQDLLQLYKSFAQDHHKVDLLHSQIKTSVEGDSDFDFRKVKSTADGFEKSYGLHHQDTLTPSEGRYHGAPLDQDTAMTSGEYSYSAPDESSLGKSSEGYSYNAPSVQSTATNSGGYSYDPSSGQSLSMTSGGFSVEQNSAISSEGYSYGAPAEQNKQYTGTQAMLQVLPSGFLADTEEVTAARNTHLRAVAEAESAAQLWKQKHGNSEGYAESYGAHAEPNSGAPSGGYSFESPSHQNTGASTGGYSYETPSLQNTGTANGGYSHESPSQQSIAQYSEGYLNGNQQNTASSFGEYPSGLSAEVTGSTNGAQAREHSQNTFGGYSYKPPTQQSTATGSEGYSFAAPTQHSTELNSGGYSYGAPVEQNKPYNGPLAMLHVLPSGYLADTEEVAAARNSHLRAVAEAEAAAQIWKQKHNDFMGYAESYGNSAGQNSGGYSYNVPQDQVTMVTSEGYSYPTPVHPGPATTSGEYSNNALEEQQSPSTASGGYSYNHPMEQSPSTTPGGYSYNAPVDLSASAGFGGHSYNTPPVEQNMAIASGGYSYNAPVPQNMLVSSSGYSSNGPAEENTAMSSGGYSYNAPTQNVENTPAGQNTAMSSGGYSNNAPTQNAENTGGDSYGVPEQIKPYMGPLAMLQVLPSGFLADTQEVAVAKDSHLRAVSEAAAMAQLWEQKHDADLGPAGSYGASAKQDTSANSGGYSYNLPDEQNPAPNTEGYSYDPPARNGEKQPWS